VLDFAGGLVVHLTAGASALMLSILMGLRLGCHRLFRRRHLLRDGRCREAPVPHRRFARRAVYGMGGALGVLLTAIFIGAAPPTPGSPRGAALATSSQFS
jgi:ammonia channel protein AmtB